MHKRKAKPRQPAADLDGILLLLPAQMKQAVKRRAQSLDLRVNQYLRQLVRSDLAKRAA